jgi:hypothetical protein
MTSWYCDWVCDDCNHLRRSHSAYRYMCLIANCNCTGDGPATWKKITKGSIMPEDKPLDKIGELLAQRGQQWGGATSTHARIAQVWSGILDTEVTALQVALCMSGLKLIRAEVNPFEPDSFDDAHGYLRIAQAIVDGEPQPEDRP